MRSASRHASACAASTTRRTPSALHSASARSACAPREAEGRAHGWGRGGKGTRPWIKEADGCAHGDALMGSCVGARSLEWCRARGTCTTTRLHAGHAAVHAHGITRDAQWQSCAYVATWMPTCAASEYGFGVAPCPSRPGDGRDVSPKPGRSNATTRHWHCTDSSSITCRQENTPPPYPCSSITAVVACGAPPSSLSLKLRWNSHGGSSSSSRAVDGRAHTKKSQNKTYMHTQCVRDYIHEPHLPGNLIY